MTTEQAPQAKRIHHVWHRPTGDVIDDFAWLSDRSNPDVIAYIDDENRYTDSWFSAHQALTDEIFAEIQRRTQEDDHSDPVRVDDWWYITTTATGAAYPTYRRGKTADDATEQIVLDVEFEARGAEYFDVGTLEISPDHSKLAWLADTDGAERYDIRFRNIDSGLDDDDQIPSAADAGVAWSADGEWLFYVVADSTERPYQVKRHRLGTSHHDDEVVFTEADESFYVGIGTTRNRQAIIIHAASKTSSESWILSPAEPTRPPQLFRERQTDLEYHVDHWGDRFVVLTNAAHVDFSVMTAALDKSTEWTELVPGHTGRRIAGIEAFAGFLALYEWHDAQEQIRIIERDGDTRVLDLDHEPHEIGFGANEQWDTDTVRLHHQSLTAPPRVIDVGVYDGSISVIKQRPTPNVDLGDYTAERRWVVAPDGEPVPVDLVRHVDTALDGTAACTIYTYGAYEISLAPWFSVARLSLLDRGHVWALAHPRGGGEMGRRWYLDGKLLHKRNTFTDVIAIAEQLVVDGVAAADRIAVRGGSAGGLCVGAGVTMRPDLFAGAVAEVPFVDITTTLSDPSMPLTITEWEEWGDPRSEPYASYIEGYSPYDNTTPGEYPAMYITAGLNDPRVGFHEPVKWTARIRSVNTGTAPVLLRTETGAGHGGPTGRYDAWHDEARVLTFLHTVLKCDEQESNSSS